MMNHLPMVGSGIGLAVVTVTWLRRSDELKQAALVICIVAALVAVPTYLTGEQAEIAVAFGFENLLCRKLGGRRRLRGRRQHRAGL